MRLIDSHCHLAHGRLRQDLAGVLKRAADAGVTAFICASSDLDEARAAAALAAQHDSIFFTAGIHPHAAKSFKAADLDELQRLSQDQRNVAIGEIGLDYHYNFSPPEAQRAAFEAQLDLAHRLGRPVVIHTREALDDTLAIIAASGVDVARVLFHCFSEPPAGASRVLDMGAMVSFSGAVTFKKSLALQQAARLVPDDRLLIETDAPYLSPEPVRKMKTNEPANVLHVATFLAALRGVPTESLAEITSANAVRFFALPQRQP